MKPIKLFYLVAIIISVFSCKKTEPETLSISTIEIKNISAYSAESGGIISYDGDQSVLRQGVCWSKNENPSLLDNFSVNIIGGDIYTSNIIGLNAESTYYARAYIIISNDTVYGNQIEFTTPNYIIFNPYKQYGSVIDIDGNEYKTITIGTQTWLAENLKTTRFQNGELIPYETDLNNWGYFQLSTSGYTWYNNDVTNKNIYGAMYNWYAASDSRNISPSGWHVATIEDWQTLVEYLGGYNGDKLRETTTAHWLSNNNYYSTNHSGFTALPGGKIATLPFGFMDIGDIAYFWTSTGTLDGSTCVYLGSEIAFDNMAPNCRGFYIRCVKD